MSTAVEVVRLLFYIGMLVFLVIPMSIHVIFLMARDWREWKKQPKDKL